MGIRLLNTFLNAQNVSGMKKNEHFSLLKRKTICVDISIYLYKFKQMATNNINKDTGELLEDPQTVLLRNIENMVQIFRKYQCELVVVFDGKPPKEKQDTIEERQQVKKEAQSKRVVYQRMLLQRRHELSEDDRESLCEKLRDEMRKSISITIADVKAVKDLLEELRVKYIQCESEADEECLRLVKKGDVWAVMSDDTDFIAQCCKRVIRNIDFDNERYDFINTQVVLFSLSIKSQDFKYLCVLAGCEQYKHNSNMNIFKLYDYYCRFLKRQKEKKNDRKVKTNINEEKSNSLFLEWLSNYIDFNIEEVQNIVNTYM